MNDAEQVETFDIRKFLRTFASGSERVIDPEFADHLRALAERPAEPNADDLLDALDAAVFLSLTGDFGIVALRTAWRLLGGDDLQAERRRKERGSVIGW